MVTWKERWKTMRLVRVVLSVGYMWCIGVYRATWPEDEEAQTSATAATWRQDDGCCCHVEQRSLAQLGNHVRCAKCMWMDKTKYKQRFVFLNKSFFSKTSHEQDCNTIHGSKHVGTPNWQTVWAGAVYMYQNFISFPGIKPRKCESCGGWDYQQTCAAKCGKWQLAMISTSHMVSLQVFCCCS